MLETWEGPYEAVTQCWVQPILWMTAWWGSAPCSSVWVLLTPQQPERAEGWGRDRILLVFCRRG